MGTQDPSVLSLQQLVNLYLIQNKSSKKSQTQKDTHCLFYLNSIPEWVELILSMVKGIKKGFPLGG